MTLGAKNPVHQFVVQGGDVPPRSVAVGSLRQFALHVQHPSLSGPCVGEAVDDDRFVARVFRLLENREVPLWLEGGVQRGYVVVQEVGVQVRTPVLRVHHGGLSPQSLCQQEGRVGLSCPAGSDQGQS